MLQHLDVVDDYVARHKESIAKKYRDSGVHRTDAKVIREHNSIFVCWFKERVLANPLDEGCPNGTLIYALAHGPSTNLATYQAYDINGYTFYTEEKDKNSDD